MNNTTELKRPMVTLTLDHPTGYTFTLERELKPIAMRNGNRRFVGVVDNWRDILAKLPAVTVVDVELSIIY
jgi:hypothetical protein